MHRTTENSKNGMEPLVRRNIHTQFYKIHGPKTAIRVNCERKQGKKPQTSYILQGGGKGRGVARRMYIHVLHERVQ